jgi:hypothetical protein
MGHVLNAPRCDEISREINERVVSALNRPVDHDKLKATSDLIVSLTKPLLEKALAGTVCPNDLKAWRKQLADNDLSYIDYSKMMRIRIGTMLFTHMLEDRCTNSEKWAQAAINLAESLDT